MRIDSMSFYTAGLNGILDNQSAIARLNQQIASGQALLAPKDDPVAMARIMDLTDRVAQRSQFSTNQTNADFTLRYESNVLTGIQDSLQSIQSKLTASTLNSDPQAHGNMAQQLLAAFNNLLDLANSRDPSGNYMFAGDATNLPANTPPFQNAGTTTAAIPITGTPTTFNGNTTTRSVVIDTGRQVQVSDSLNPVFQSGVTGSDLLQTLDEARQRLQSANAGDLTQANIDQFNQVVNSAIKNLSNIEYRVAGARNQIADVQKSTQALLLIDQTALGNLSQVNQAQAIIELQTRQTTLTAAMTAFSQTSSLSLFKFL